MENESGEFNESLSLLAWAKESKQGIRAMELQAVEIRETKRA